MKFRFFLTHTHPLHRPEHRAAWHWAASWSRLLVEAVCSSVDWNRWNLDKAFGRIAGLSQMNILFPSRNYLQQFLWTNRAWCSLIHQGEGSRRVPRNKSRSQGGTRGPGMQILSCWVPFRCVEIKVESASCPAETALIPWSPPCHVGSLPPSGTEGTAGCESAKQGTSKYYHCSFWAFLFSFFFLDWGQQNPVRLPRQAPTPQR